MQKSMISNHKFLFVCYQAGSGGEATATKISNFDSCIPLEFYKTEENRTIITNEFFKKTFLNAVGPIEKLLGIAQQILDTKELSNKLNIVPSHWDYTFLLPHFPNSKFVRIVHEGNSEIRENSITKIRGGKFRTFQELVGFCLVYVDDITLKNLLTEKQINLTMNGGQVLDVLDPFVSKEATGCNDLCNYVHLVEHNQVFNMWYNAFEESKDQILNFIKD
jgi:hypothetical protein